MKKNKKGYILIEIAIFIMIISMLCVSLVMIISNKITANNRDRINQNLYLTAKSTINVFYDYFEEDKELLKKYAKNKETGVFYIEEREDIESITVRFLETENKVLIEVTVLDKSKNQLMVSAKIPY